MALSALRMLGLRVNDEEGKFIGDHYNVEKYFLPHSMRFFIFSRLQDPLTSSLLMLVLMESAQPSHYDQAALNSSDT